MTTPATDCPRVHGKSQCPTLWLVPARGGSKGIPGKNVRPFAGRPLVLRALDQALALAAPGDTVYLSTDSDEIRNLGLQLGDVAPFKRPAELASDTASTYDVLLHALAEFERRGKIFGRLVLLQPTSPFRTLDDIRRTLDAWHPGIDMAVTVTEAKANPYFNAFEADSGGFLHLSKGDGSVARRQDAPKVWEYTGAVYAITVSALALSPMSRFKRIVPVPVDASHSVDLDTPEDWAVAETLANLRNTDCKCQTP